ncbi:MAG TPA: hypothetical protein PLE33_00400 [Candidatus Cloacimonas sp.]|nr:hypothetical protein [Candidatus Cloacimonas sp.]
MAYYLATIYPWQKTSNYPLKTTILQNNPIINIIREGVINVGASRKEIK